MFEKILKRNSTSIFCTGVVKSKIMQYALWFVCLFWRLDQLKKLADRVKKDIKCVYQTPTIDL